MKSFKGHPADIRLLLKRSFSMLVNRGDDIKPKTGEFDGNSSFKIFSIHTNYSKIETNQIREALQ